MRSAIKRIQNDRRHTANGRVVARRGGAVLETALVMGLLIMLSFGTAEYGYFFFVKNMLTPRAVVHEVGWLSFDVDPTPKFAA